MGFSKRDTAKAGKVLAKSRAKPARSGSDLAQVSARVNLGRVAEAAPLTVSGLAPMHPGELLREVVLPELKTGGTTRAKFAELLGLSRSRFYDLLDEKAPVTPDLAVLIGKLCGNGPELWLNLQQRWDLARARERLADRVAALPTLKGAEAA